MSGKGKSLASKTLFVKPEADADGLESALVKSEPQSPPGVEDEYANPKPGPPGKDWFDDFD